MEKQFVVLYTHQKQKKAKTWHDGTLKHTGTGTRALLYDEKGCRLDSIHIKVDEIKLGEQLESDRYYILVEDIKAKNTQNAPTINPNQPEKNQTPLSSQVTFSRARCAGLKRKKSGFMPPRMVKQACVDNSQDSQSDCDRFTVFPVSGPQHYNDRSGTGSNRSGTGSRVPLVPLQTKDTCVPVGMKSLETSNSFPKYENMERNLFNLYSRYNKQENGSESENSSQASSTNGENRKVLSPWSVCGSKDSSPSLKGAIFRHEPVSGSGLCPSMSYDKEVDDKSPRRFVAGDKNLNKSKETDIVKFEKLDNRQSEANVTYSKVIEERGIGQSSNGKLYGSGKDAFLEKSEQLNDNNKRNLTQIMNLLRKKPVPDCAVQGSMKEYPRSNEKCFKIHNGNRSIDKTSGGELGCSTKESVCLDTMKLRENSTNETEALKEREFGNGLNESETVADKKEKSSTSLAGSADGNYDSTISANSKEDIANQISAKEDSNLLEEFGESCAEEDIIGSFQINFSPLSHVTMSDDEEDIDDKEKTTAKDDHWDSLHNEKYSEETAKFSYDTGSKKIDSETGCESNKVSGQNVITDVAGTSKAFHGGNAEECVSDLNVLKTLHSTQESMKTCTKGNQAVVVEKDISGKPNLETKIDILHDIDRQFADSIKEKSNRTTRYSDTILESFEDSFEYNDESCNMSVVKETDENNCALKSVCQQKCDEIADHDNVKETDYDVDADICDNELDVQCNFDDKIDIKCKAIDPPPTGKRFELLELDNNITEYAVEKLVENNGSQFSRTTSQDTMDFSCNTLDDDSQNYFGITTLQLDKLDQSNRTSGNDKTINKCVGKVATRNSKDEVRGSRCFEHKNYSMSQNMDNRGALCGMEADDNVSAYRVVNTGMHQTSRKPESTQPGPLISSQWFDKRATGDLKQLRAPFHQDLEEWDTEDPMGNFDANSRTIYSHPNGPLQKQMRGEAQQKEVKSALGSYGTHGISSAVVSRVYHTGLEESKGSYWTTCRNTSEMPLIASSPAFELDVHRQESPFQQLSSSGLSEQSSPSFYIDWQNNKPQIQRAEKPCEDEAGAVISNRRAFGSLDRKYAIERPATQNIGDDEEIYDKLYRPRLMYQQDRLQEEFDCTEKETLSFNESHSNFSQKSQLPSFKRFIDSKNSEKSVNDSIKISQDSLGYNDFRSSKNLISSHVSHSRQLCVADFSQSPEEFFLHGESKPPVSPLLHSASERVDFNLKEDMVNQTPELNNVNKLKNSRWQSFVASQASDDCDIDMNKLTKKVTGVDKSKKAFIALENTPGLFNTQRVVYQTGMDKQTVPVPYFQSFTDKMGSQQENSCGDSGSVNSNVNQNFIQQSNALECQSTVYQYIQAGPEKETTIVDKINDDVAVNVTEDEKHRSNLIPGTVSSADSLEQLLADDDFDLPVIPRNEKNKTSIIGGPEQQVPELKGCNSEKCEKEENADSDACIKSKRVSETGENVSQNLTRDFTGTSLKENADTETDTEKKVDKFKTEKIGDICDAVVPSHDVCKRMEELDENYGNTENVVDLKLLEPTDSSQEICITEDEISLDDGNKVYQKETQLVSVAPKILNAKEYGENHHSDQSVQKKHGVEQNENGHNNFSLDDSLDLSLSLDTDNVSLPRSDKLGTRTHSLRIGWRPPVKSGIQDNRGQSSNMTGNTSQQQDVHTSEKLKPTFKCLRLLAQSKTRVNSESHLNADSELSARAAETLPSFLDSESDLDNQQKWKFRSPKQSPYLILANKRSADGGDKKPIQDSRKEIDDINSRNTVYNQNRFQDGKLSSTVPNRRFKPPSLTRTPVVNGPVSSPCLTPRFPVKRVVAEKQGACVSQTELRFPCRSETEGMQNVLRHVVIPDTFPSAAVYKQVLTAALTEYVNTQLFDVSRRFHHALSKVDTSGYSEYKSRNSRSSVNNPNPPCQCGVPAKLISVKKEGPNCGRYFYACSADRKQQCKFFQWADETRRGGMTSGSKRKIQDANSLNIYMKDHRVHFYGECQLIKRTKENINRYFKAPKWARNRGEGDMAQKKQILLKLPYKGRSSLYAKDDIWVISKHIDFDPLQTFLARSTYYGPSSSLEVEIEPLTGYSPSNWKSEEVCHAILAGNVSSELSCIDNVKEHVNTQSLPVLPHLLNRQNENTEKSINHSKGFQAPRALAGNQSSRNIHIHSEQMDDLSRQYIAKYNLNTDQAEALKRMANMFSIEKSAMVDSILLIHGVFGAGKSYLLSVMVLFLVEVFQLNDSQSPDQPFPWKLLISSTTNVAVDRILIGLLELGFEDFVRVGSVKKIAKPVLPFSVHASGTDNQELKDLQEMLRSGELTATEKSQVRQSIEKHRHGENKKKLGRVRVVGATCASCSLTCLNNMEFPLVLLDECSQMTEPASLLPIARFGCQKLLLVGDPKQLDPTIQGTEAAHRNGLEQTMFDRLIKMGSMPTLLRTQYRCHPYISAAANKLFYGGMLEDGVSVCDRKPLLEILPTICYYDVERGEECCEGAGSYYNEREAQFVVFLLQVLLSLEIEPSAVGVITLYKSQMARIADLLSVQGDSVDMKGVQVSTVDAFQGGERDVIILSTVRSQACGFIDNDKRTNVALTRAKRHLLIVGNLNNLSKNILWAKVINHCKCYENGIQSADEARHSLEKYLDNLKTCETSRASEKGKPVNSQNSTASEKPRKRKPKRKRKFSNTENNTEAHQGNTHSQNENSYATGKVSRRTKKGIRSNDIVDEMLDDDFDTEIMGDILETDEIEVKLDSSEGGVNSRPMSLAETQEDDVLSGEMGDNCQSDFQHRKRPRHVTKLSSLLFDSDSENMEDEDLPSFNCD